MSRVATMTQNSIVAAAGNIARFVSWFQLSRVFFFFLHKYLIPSSFFFLQDNWPICLQTHCPHLCDWQIWVLRLSSACCHSCGLDFGLAKPIHAAHMYVNKWCKKCFLSFCRCAPLFQHRSICPSAPETHGSSTEPVVFGACPSSTWFFCLIYTAETCKGS